MYPVTDRRSSWGTELGEGILRYACVDVAGSAIRQRKDFEHGSPDSFCPISRVVVVLAFRWASVALEAREVKWQEIAGDKDGTS